MLPRISFVTLPGISGSGSDHWQTLWEKADASFSRFAPKNWDEPDLEDWIAALDRAVRQAERPCILVAHSLACLLIAHWAARSRESIAGAFLVSLPDPSGPNFPTAAVSFRAVPDLELQFPALILASDDDPYADPTYVRERAHRWGASLVEVGALGHVNAASGLGDWPQGRALLRAFAAGAVR